MIKLCILFSINIQIDCTDVYNYLIDYKKKEERHAEYGNNIKSSYSSD